MPVSVETPVPVGVETPELGAVPVDVTGDFLPQLDEQSFQGIFPKGTLQGGGGKRSQLINEAMSWLGIPYVWGGASRNGVDCSGLVQQVFARLGIELPRVSFQQAGAGAKIPLDQLRPGDLVAWDNSSRNNGADHIAIYAGDGWIIEAPRPGLNVRRRRLGNDEYAYGVSLESFY